MTKKQRQRITDTSRGKYFHQMLNMADDDLTPYEYRLLGHYIRVDGCWESVRTTAKITRMSVGMVVKTRNRLEELGYITVELSDYDTCFITVVDRMAENIARYSAQSVHGVNAGVHVVNTPSAQSVHGVNQRRTIQEEQTEEENTVVVPQHPATSGEVVFQTELLQPKSNEGEGTDDKGTVDAELFNALSQHLNMTQALAEQLVTQYGTARVWQVLRYIQKPENRHLKIGWLRSQLKAPTVAFETVTAPVISTPPAVTDVSESDIETQLDGTSVDSSVYSLAVHGKDAATIWNTVAIQLIGKGHRDIKSATLKAYDAATQTYTVRVTSTHVQQQLAGRYRKVVDKTLTDLHAGASVVFVVRESEVAT